MPAGLGFILVAFVVAFVSGCHNSSKAATQPSADEEAMNYRRTTHWDEKPLPIEQKPVVILEGPAPLAHIFDVGGPIRIIDLTSNLALLSTTVPSRTLVRIDDRHGVTVGQDNLVPGPLPAGHHYAIVAEPATPNVIRQGVGPPGDVPR